VTCYFLQNKYYRRKVDGEIVPALFLASATVQFRPSLCWDVMWRRLAAATDRSGRNVVTLLPTYAALTSRTSNSLKVVSVHAINAYWDRISTSPSLTSAVDVWQWLTSRSDHLTHDKEPRYPLKRGGWVGLTASIDVWEKRKISCTCSELNPGPSNS